MKPIYLEPEKREDRGERWSVSPWERVKESTDQTIGSLFGAGSMIADAMGFDKGRDWAESKAIDWFEKAADRDLSHQAFMEISNPLDAAKWTAETVISYLPDLALMALGGMGLATGAGRIAATKAGTKTVKNMVEQSFRKKVKDKMLDPKYIDVPEQQIFAEVAKETVKGTAALLGASSVEGLQASGTFYLDDREGRGDDANPFRAMGVGLGTTAIGLLSPVTRGVAGGVIGRLPSSISLGGVVVGEFFEEMGQEGWAMLNEAGIEPNVTLAELVSTKEGQARLWESGVAGAVLGLTLGGGAKGVIGDFKRKKTPEEESKGVLESAGIDTSGDTPAPVLPPDLVGPAANTAPPMERRQEVAGRPTPLKSIEVNQNFKKEDGTTASLRVPADVAIEEADNGIEQWYLLRECIIG